MPFHAHGLYSTCGLIMMLLFLAGVEYRVNDSRKAGNIKQILHHSTLGGDNIIDSLEIVV